MFNFSEKTAKGQTGKWKQNPRQENDLAYESLGKKPPESMVEFFWFSACTLSASEKYENVWRERMEKPISNRLSKYLTLIIGISNMIEVKLM